MCFWSCELIDVCVQVCIARFCASMCVSHCVCAGRPKRHCAAATTGPPSPPTRHNKEQLNAAALPAEEPTASHTSTNRQICLKPKGRSNKSQPTGSNPPSADSNQKVTGWLHPITQYRRSGRVTVRCAVLHEKKTCNDSAGICNTRLVHLDWKGQEVKSQHDQQQRNFDKMCLDTIGLASFKTLVFSV